MIGRGGWAKVKDFLHSDAWITLRSVIGIVLLSVLLVLTYRDVDGHNSEITAIGTNTQQIINTDAKLQTTIGQLRKTVHSLKIASKQHGQENQTLKKDIGAVTDFANHLQSVLSQNHAVTDANQTSICDAITQLDRVVAPQLTGCTLPDPSTIKAP